MKVALTCDHLIKRSHVHELLEVLIGLYPTADIFTLVHIPGNVLGPIEARPIHSSYLGNFIKDENALERFAFLIPSACQKLKIPCCYDLVIDLSSGFSHAFISCKDSKRITYLYDWKIPKKHFVAKIFHLSNNLFLKKALEKKSLLAFASSFLKEKLNITQGQIIVPSFNNSDFPLLPEIREFLPGKKNIVAINSSLELKDATSLALHLQNHKFDFLFFGPDQHLEKLKIKLGPDYFFGDRCSGDLCLFLASAFITIDFSKDLFPVNALKSLSLGRPVLTLDNGERREFFKNSKVSFADLNDFPKIIQEISSQKESGLLEPRTLRETAMRFSPLKFKSLMRALSQI